MDRSEEEAYRLDPGLVEWAYQLTKHIPLADTEAMQKRRALYTGLPESSAAPARDEGR